MRKRMIAFVPIAALAALLGIAGTGPASYLAFAQDQENVMQTKLNQGIELITTAGRGDETYIAGIGEGMEALNTSNVIVLPTNGVGDTDQMFSEHRSMMREFIGALTTHINNAQIGSDRTKAEAIEARNFLQLVSEALDVIGAQTRQCPPANPSGCALLNQGSEAGAVTDTIYAGFAREVRSPFFLRPRAREPREDIIATDVKLRPDRECQSILKESKGIKVIVRAIVIPIWIEPWFARARIVGFRTVWVWEYVPAEFLKTITMCNTNGSVRTTVSTRQIIERQLMPFWKYLVNPF